MPRRSAANPDGLSLFDSHCHLTDAQFATDLAVVIKSARSAGVRELMTVSQSVPDSKQTVEIAGRFDGVYCAVGVHPHEADGFRSSDIHTLKDMCIDSRVKAIGEIGLDFFRAISAKSNQEMTFRAQVGLARMVGMPMVIHARDAGSAVREVLNEEGYSVGVLHCFSGEGKMLDWAIEHGMYVSLAGNVTYDDHRLVEAVKRIPRDRLMIETDAPYLAPVPERGKRNEPALLRLVAMKVAAILGMTPAELGTVARDNARCCFGIS